MMDISERLKTARLNAGFDTQKRVTDALGLERTRYLKWEKGNNQPSLEMLAKLCQLFGVSADYILGIETPERADGLTPKEVAKLRKMLELMKDE